MNLLLDTHVVLWWLAGGELEPPARKAIETPQNAVMVSAVSLWEASIKAAVGKLRVEADLEEALAAAGFDELPVRWSHAGRAGALPPHHRDPFDRMLVAQAQQERLTLVTRDRVFERYDVDVLWA